MKEAGLVLDTTGDFATVVFLRTDMCDTCGMCGRAEEGTDMIVQIRNTKGVKRGDKVMVELKSGSVLRAGIIAYLFPLAMLFLGALLGYKIALSIGMNADLTAAITAVVAVGVAFLIIKLLDPMLKRGEDFVPVITEIVTPEAENPEADEKAEIDTKDEGI